MNARILLGTVAVVTALTAAIPSRAAAVDCSMRFDLTSWSVIYKRTSGTGKITCTDGTHMNVKLTANGGGLTVGKNKITGGKANFSGERSINDLPGTYLAADASFGTPKAGTAQIMTKGDISVSLAGAGRGFGLGVSLGGLTIEKAP